MSSTGQRNDNDIARQVIEDIEHRRAKGYEQYGQYVQVDSGYDMLWEAYEECLDQAIYLRAEIRRREKVKNEQRRE
jgi:protoporphyrinogen oxidase